MKLAQIPRRMRLAGRFACVNVVFEKEKLRFIVLEDVGGERVVMAIEAPAADFEAFLPKAQAVLKTVEWEGT